jgi:hypothetical protein
LETIDVASVPLSIHFPAENLRINFFSSSRSNAASSALCFFKFKRLSMALIPTALPEFSSKKRSMNWSLIGSEGLSCFLSFSYCNTNAVLSLKSYFIIRLRFRIY